MNGRELSTDGRVGAESEAGTRDRAAASAPFVPAAFDDGSMPEARTLRVAAIYMLSELGRKASLLSGGDGRARQEIALEVPSHRLHLVSVDARGIARLKLRPFFQLDSDNRIVRVDNPPV